MMRLRKNIFFKRRKNMSIGFAKFTTQVMRRGQPNKKKIKC